MNRFILILASVAFLIGGLSEIAHAATPEAICAHQAVDNQDCSDNQEPEQTSINHCNECCSIHVHVLNNTLPDTSMANFPKERAATMLHSSLISNDLSSLHRPPIV